jgi:hypothetical protein
MGMRKCTKKGSLEKSVGQKAKKLLVKRERREA